jgi:hypothetical protein
MLPLPFSRGARTDTLRRSSRRLKVLGGVAPRALVEPRLDPSRFAAPATRAAAESFADAVRDQIAEMLARF